MKSSIIRSLAIAFMSASVLSSCSLMQKGEFAQRKYYNFPRANHSVDNKGDEFAKTNAVKATHVEQILTEPVQPELQTMGPELANVQSAPSTKIDFPSNKKSNNPTWIGASDVLNNNAHVLTERRLNAKSKPAKPYFATTPGLFIQVIAAIFLPPIGCFLHANNKTNSWFWLTLLFCLAALVCLAVADPLILATIGILLYLAASVTAVLVVLDVF